MPAPVAGELSRWLAPARSIRPRLIWPAQIALATGNSTLQAQLLTELRIADESPQTIDSAIDAWLFRTTPDVVDALTPNLRELLDGDSADVLRTRGRLEGRRAEGDHAARAWVAATVLRGPSPAIASTVTKTIADSLGASGRFPAAEFLRWLAGLLASSHTDAVRRIASVLKSDRCVDGATFEQIVPDLLRLLPRRLESAVLAKEEPQVVRALLDCLVRADRIAPTPAQTVGAIYDSLVARILDPVAPSGASTDVAGDVKNLTNLCGTLMARRMPASDVRDRVGEYLGRLDPDRIGKKSVKSIESMLIGIWRRDPGALDWMAEIFARPEPAVGVKMAIATTFLMNDERKPGGRAAALRNDPNCPAAVATHLANELRG